jgi:opacity protein-like surface antigen
MKKAVFVAVLLLGCCALAMAEEAPKAEFFGGYSYYRCNPESININGSCDLNGWIGSFTLNATKWIGGVGEISGNYGSVGNADKGKVASFLFGPRVFIRRNEKVTPFFHALAGNTYMYAKAGRVNLIKINTLTLAFGGGIDLKVSKNMAVRPFQVDYVTFDPKDKPSPTDRMHNFRFAAGIVFRLGERGN